MSKKTTGLCGCRSWAEKTKTKSVEFDLTKPDHWRCKNKQAGLTSSLMIGYHKKNDGINRLEDDFPNPDAICLQALSPLLTNNKLTFQLILRFLFTPPI
jgi:hypothetical protein